jgi:hypothetical protein
VEGSKTTEEDARRLLQTAYTTTLRKWPPDPSLAILVPLLCGAIPVGLVEPHDPGLTERDTEVLL